MISNEEIKKILELIEQAYEQGGKKIETAILVDKITEDDTIEGEILIDNRDKKEIQ